MNSGNYFQYLPSKKFVSRLIVVVAIVLAGYLIVGRGDTVKNKKADNENGVSALSPGESRPNLTAINIDTDKDGLKDWEESLWKTDSTKVDTDMDGFADKEEIDGGYNPTDKTSNPSTGKKDESFFNKTNVLTNNNIDINFTKSIANFLETNLSADGGKSMNNLSVDDLLKNDGFNDALRQYLISYDIKFPFENIKIAKDSNAITVKFYREWLRKNLPKNPFNDGTRTEEEIEMRIIADALKTNNYVDIDRYVAYLQQALSVFKNTETPLILADAHKKEIELVMSAIMVFEDIKLSQKDALRAVLAINQFKKILTDTSDLKQTYLNIYKEYEI